MKLLFDENLSDRIVQRVEDLYPGSAHVKSYNLTRADDGLIWSFASQHSFVIVSKDADFHQRSLVFGHPPKFIFLRVGNCPTSRITEVLRSNFVIISAFDADLVASILILPSQQTA